MESSESEPSKFPVPFQSTLYDLGKRPWFKDISLQSSITNASSVGQVSRHRRLLSSLQVLADPQFCLSPSSSPRTQALAYSKQSVPTSPCGCLLDLHRLCARLPRRYLQIILPSAEERPTSVFHPAFPLLTEALPPQLSRATPTRTETGDPLSSLPSGRLIRGSTPVPRAPSSSASPASPPSTSC